MRRLVEELCSDACAGRAPGTEGGRLARGLVAVALRGAGLDPIEQPVAGCGGANLLASVSGDRDRWILIAAHYDHLGAEGGAIYRGADDNAAAVAILVEVAGRLAARRPDGRGVIVAAFDGEEPPHFLTPSMGSEHYARHPVMPLERTDLMICMDLVGHALGPAGVPGPVAESVFCLGAERAAGLSDEVERVSRPGVVVRRLDAEAVPPLSDYAPFWRRKVPFLFLTNGRSRHYHTPADTPDRLDYGKMAATADWLEELVRGACQRDAVFAFADRRDDASTLRSIAALTGELASASPQAKVGQKLALELLARCDREGRLPDSSRGQMQMLVFGLEQALA
jgi:Zn-dependent M28 family amino/carboxypeptidase